MGAAAVGGGGGGGGVEVALRTADDPDAHQTHPAMLADA